jgi:YbbR domain-containing protein
MKDFFIKLRNTVFKKTNFKAFFFFLFFSVVIWFLVQFSKSYEQDISVDIQYINAPKDKIVNKNIDNFSVRLTDNGFNLAWFSFIKPKISVNLEDLEVNGGNLIYSIEKNKQALQDRLNIDTDNLLFLKDTLQIPYLQKKVKKIPIVSNIEVSFDPGYSTSEKLILKPDSVTVSGAPQIVDSIKQIKTESLRLNNIKKSLNGKVKLDTTGYGTGTFYELETSYKLKVEKFTEGRAEVPIEIINAPENLNISIFPKKIVVIYVASLENYKTISKSDFRVVCDYKELSEGQNFFIPKLIEEPTKISSARLNLNKVQFIIKK